MLGARREGKESANGRRNGRTEITGLTWPKIDFNVSENESFTLETTCP